MTSLYLESCEAIWLAGGIVELSDYLAATNSQRRLLMTIGLEVARGMSA